MSLPFTDWSSNPFWDGLSLSVSYLWTASVRNRPCERSTKSQTEIMYVWTSCHAILFYYNIVPKSWESMCMWCIVCFFSRTLSDRPSSFLLLKFHQRPRPRNASQLGEFDLTSTLCWSVFGSDSKWLLLLLWLWRWIISPMIERGPLTHTIYTYKYGTFTCI